ncbi:MAG: ABC transporter ATP-binding protein [Rhodobacterales bacterium RIFCSPHIGHO2_02_FULL_62_130]|jgi:branched-chain amino acid transport system ATP-binding protein|nr:MAG: ABC transporter ATP-binding protein [Rhodobacterales bacterium RIFCSPHIGHO2_02_FULL_62_130]OHC55911.1 MAG: ABC transporter ATP-binding protein [Rhodobacterales bacterium RIFCSPHIGHO2_12_FULL_62_75]HCY99997.1 ABC transporter ATP-binding protein [Rhodobacter sp.]
MAAEIVLEARDLTKRFGGVAAVNGMSLSVSKGEILGLIGPNGAGKTTMFDLLAGSVRVSAGSIRLMGRDITTEPAYRRLAGGMARTFQIPRPFPDLSLLENMLIARQSQTGERLWANFTAPRRIAAEERAAREKALGLLDLVALRRLADDPARVLSGGQRKLLELARVMMADPQVILLDEPAAGVNPALLEVLISRIQEINASGVTFVLIEHNIDMVSRLCNRIVVMAQGALLFQGRPDEVAKEPRVIEAYLGGASA